MQGVHVCVIRALSIMYGGRVWCIFHVLCLCVVCMCIVVCVIYVWLSVIGGLCGCILVARSFPQSAVSWTELSMWHFFLLVHT